MKKNTAIAIFFIIGISLLSCQKDEEVTIDPSENQPYKSGVFVTNEGPFQTGTGTVSYYNRDDGSVTHNIFFKKNNRPLGNIVQSMAIHNNRAYIVVNNAATIEVVDKNSFTSLGQISSLTSPRYYLGIDNNKAYVSDWANHIAVINPATGITMATILTGEGPERMLRFQDKVFVCNIGGFNNDSSITVIDCQADTVLHTISTAARPAGIVLDKNDHLWVLCSGIGWNGYPQSGDTEAHLMCIDPHDYSIIKDIAFQDNVNHPEKLVIDAEGHVLYYNHPDGIFTFNIEDDVLSVNPLIDRQPMAYALGYDSLSSWIFISDPVDYIQDGWVFMYDKNGLIQDSMQGGIIPGNFTFN